MDKDLSIIILNYNTKDLVLDCIESIKSNTSGIKYEIIVVDNGSDEKLPNIPGAKIILNGKNLGFAAGNNKARGTARGKYILFLNSDTLVHEKTLQESVEYMENNKEVGAMSVKTVLPDGSLDRDARRSFPTPWVAFTHFSGLDRIFPKSKIFSKYWYGYRSAEKIQEVDVIQGAFCLVRGEVLEEVNWYDESYFLDGEDIDLCWKIKVIGGHKIIYYPDAYITHIKKATKNKVKRRFVGQGVEAMEIFYKKRMWDRYPLVLNWLVILGIRIMKLIRS